MRIIKFRGKSISANEYVFGCLIKKRFNVFADWMIEDENGLGSDVITESISQFTGMLDKNGIEIYENDIVSFGRDTNYKVIYQDACFYLFHHNGLKEIDGTDYKWGALYRAKEHHFEISVVS